MCSIRAVLFDVGNTLSHIQYGVIAKALTAAGFSATLEEVRQAEYRVRPILDRFLSEGRDTANAIPSVSIVDRPQSQAGGRSTETPDTFRHYLMLILRELKIETGLFMEPILAELRAYHARNNLWSYRDEAALPVLQSLKESGYLLGVISNSDGQVERLLRRVSLAEHFDFIVDSGRERVEKPHPAIFQIALQRGCLEPSEAVYVGDIYSIDIVGASRAGLKGILMDPIGAWKEVNCLKAGRLLEVVEIVERLRCNGRKGRGARGL